MSQVFTPPIASRADSITRARLAATYSAITDPYKVLIVQAIGYIQAARDELFCSEEVDGVIEDAGVALEVQQMDSWLRDAKSLVQGSQIERDVNAAFEALVTARKAVAE